MTLCRSTGWGASYWAATFGTPSTDGGLADGGRRDPRRPIQGMLRMQPRLLMAVFGEPLVAMVQNLGQTDNSYRSVGGTNKVLSQGFTTGPNSFGYRLQGIGVNIEGSDDSNGNPQVPSEPTSVSVAVHADSSGKPGAKLFDLVSPTEFAAGHSFFEAPPGAVLAPNTSYVLVWRYNRGTWHRLQRTSSNSEDTGAQEGSSIANAYYLGADLGSLSEDSGGNALELAVYTVVNDKAPFVEGGIPVPLSWLHIPDGAYAGYQFRLLYVTHRGRLPTSGDIEEYNTWVREEAAGNVVRGEEAEPPYKYTDPIIWENASEFRAVVCTADVDARTNTGMAGAGVPIHWLDGGWDDRPTLIANSYADFYDDEWGKHRIRRLCHRELRLLPQERQGVDRVRRLWRPASVCPHGCDLSHGHGRRGHTERFGGQ